MKRLLSYVSLALACALPVPASAASADVAGAYAAAVGAVNANDMHAACGAFVRLAAVSHGFADLDATELAKVKQSNGSAFMDAARAQANAGHADTACAEGYASAVAWRKKGDEMSTRMSLREAGGYAARAGFAAPAVASHATRIAPAARSEATQTAHDASGDYFAQVQPGDLGACAHTSGSDTRAVVAAARSCAEAQFLRGEALRAAGRSADALAAYDSAKRYAQITGMGITMTLKTVDPIEALHNAKTEAGRPFTRSATGLIGHYKCYFYGMQGLSLSRIGYVDILSPSTYQTTYLHAGNRGTWRFESLPPNPGNDIYGKLLFTGGPFAGHYAYANRKKNGDRAFIWPHNEKETPWDTADTWCYYSP